MEEIASCRADLSPDNSLQTPWQVRKLRKAFGHLGRSTSSQACEKAQTDSAMQAHETAIGRALSSDEPSAHDECHKPTGTQRLPRSPMGNGYFRIPYRPLPLIMRVLTTECFRRAIEHQNRCQDILNGKDHLSLSRDNGRQEAGY